MIFGLIFAAAVMAAVRTQHWLDARARRRRALQRLPLALRFAPQRKLLNGIYHVPPEPRSLPGPPERRRG